MNPWLLSSIVCPKDRGSLTLSEDGRTLSCQSGHRYPVVDGVPVLLSDAIDATLWVAEASLQAAEEDVAGQHADRYFVDTLGLTIEERSALSRQLQAGEAAGIDPVVQYMVGATSGYLYSSVIANLPFYPIPEIRLPAGKGQRLLDLGCNWGRWCAAAARKGYSPVGIDPSLGAVLAARRMFKQLELDGLFVVADARVLPFKDGVFDVAFSYSVLQHLSKSDVKMVLEEVARVLKPGGASLIQMANRFGIRSLYHLARRRFREGTGFEVRYWTPAELQQAFSARIGATSLSVDGFFGLGIQPSDLAMLSPRHKLVVLASEAFRRLSLMLPWLKVAADSLYVHSTASPRPPDPV